MLFLFHLRKQTNGLFTFIIFLPKQFYRFKLLHQWYFRSLSGAVNWVNSVSSVHCVQSLIIESKAAVMQTVVEHFFYEREAFFFIILNNSSIQQCMPDDARPSSQSLVFQCPFVVGKSNKAQIFLLKYSCCVYVHITQIGIQCSWIFISIRADFNYHIKKLAFKQDRSFHYT